MAAVAGTLPAARSVSPTWARFKDALRRHPTAIFGAVVLLAMIAVAIAAPVLGTVDPQSMSPVKRLRDPWGEYWFGSDMLGRDVYSRVLYGARVKDMETCYKMMRREIALSLDLECRRFDVEAEISAKLLRAGHKIYELPISYTARYENKKLSPSDGLPAIRALWKYRSWKPK